MKFTFFFLIGLIFAQSVVARNWPLRPIEPRNPNLVDDIIDWIKNSGKTTSTKLAEAINQIISEVKNFLDEAKKDGSYALGELVKLVQKLKGLSFGDLDELSEEIHKILEDIENGVTNVLDEVTNKFNETMDIANHTLFNATRQMQNWRINIELQLVDLPTDKKEEGLTMIEEFFEKSLTECYSCSQGAIQPIKDLYHKVRQLVDSTIPLARGAVDKIEDCIRDSGVDLYPIVKCVKGVKDFVITSVTDIPRQIFGLKRELITLAIKELFNVPCIAATRIKIEFGKKNVQQKITKLLGTSRLLAVMYGY